MSKFFQKIFQFLVLLVTKTSISSCHFFYILIKIYIVHYLYKLLFVKTSNNEIREYISSYSYQKSVFNTLNEPKIKLESNYRNTNYKFFAKRNNYTNFGSINKEK